MSFFCAAGNKPAWLRNRKHFSRTGDELLLDSAERDAFFCVKFLRLSAKHMENAIKGGFQIWARSYRRDVFVGDTVENRTLGMVKAGGRAAASHRVCRLLYIHLRTFSHPSWICVRVRIHYPLPLEKGSKRLWHACNTSIHIKEYQHVSPHM